MLKFDIFVRIHEEKYFSLLELEDRQPQIQKSIDLIQKLMKSLQFFNTKARIPEFLKILSK